MGFSIVVGVIAALAVLLVLLLLMQAGQQKSSSRSLPRAARARAPVCVSVEVEGGSINLFAQEMLYQRADESMRCGDWNAARQWLQKIAYGLVRPDVSEEEKLRFKRFMTQFAARDPLYVETINKLQPLLRERPGLMQSELTKGMDGKKAEALRYVLYFAHELGDVVRIKKGRSYQLHPPGVTIEG